MPPIEPSATRWPVCKVSRPPNSLKQWHSAIVYSTLSYLSLGEPKCLVQSSCTPLQNCSVPPTRALLFTCSMRAFCLCCYHQVNVRLLSCPLSIQSSLWEKGNRFLQRRWWESQRFTRSLKLWIKVFVMMLRYVFVATTTKSFEFSKIIWKLSFIFTSVQLAWN